MNQTKNKNLRKLLIIILILLLTIYPKISFAANTNQNMVYKTALVIKEQAVTGINLKQSDRTVPVGTNLQLDATISPSNATNKKILWSSSNTNVATVSSTGMVKGVKVGKATITAKTNNGKTATCLIRVNIPAKKITLNKTISTIPLGSTETLKVNFNPTNTSSKEIQWTSSNPDIVKLPDTKKDTITITAIKTGTTTITATSKYGLTAYCNVNVKKAGSVSTFETNLVTAYNGRTVTKAQLTNFRNVYAGNLGINTLYRCIDPIKGESKYKKAASYADQMLKIHNVKTVLNLCDNSSSLLEDSYSDSTYYKSLIKKGNVYAKHMNVNSNFCKDVTKGLKLFTKKDGPYAVHCYVGRDRTGFAILLLECLMNVPYDYMYNDYMTSIRNLNLIGRSNSSTSTYNKHFSTYLERLTKKSASDPKNPKASDWKNVNFVKCAENYLKNGGMTSSEIKKLKANLSKNH